MDTHISTAELNATLARLRAAWDAKRPDYAQRMDDLARLREAFKRRLGGLVDAMAADFGRRSRHESLLTDGMTVLHEIDQVRAHLRRWMRPSRRAVDWIFLPARAEIRYQPLGVVGVIAPWNYPVNLALIPLVSAIGAGNHVMLKPSEYTPRTAEALAELIAEVFPADRVATVQGGAEVASAFASLPLDHLLFTGSTEVGRKVMAAAAPNLTPVTLELGGKSPAVVAPDYPLDVAAARIAAGKLLNAGQTCIAPDYVLLVGRDPEQFVGALRDYMGRHYPALRESPDYTSIINDRQYARLQGLVDEARARGARVVTLPDDAAHNPAERVFAPTVVVGAPDDSRVMETEIFGPILPVVVVDSVEAAVAYINRRPRPLALYHFDNDRRRTRHVLDHCVAGGVSVNDCLLHNAQGELPFGGVGPSGMGHYHGHHGFVTFSKQMPVFHQFRWSSLALLRPPYKGLADFMTRFLTR
ncbi:coniferyl aldehyde dehydrogenase [Tahibacter amnicola]|uniref:Aldehyde dehydrogenase n=1 Tax=Tahibacter amnicola TaxID=2976241 RepID=A0ABY6BFA5_9GAMM|nr:coniferyl aldehyde dehydrogenase [Tahibacter amnicola]UXI68439.1 coniferyl aldehyde dehydrogenase [Tahibacter amnicola]